MSKFSPPSSKTVLNERDPVEQPDLGMDHARNLVARILEFVASDPRRFARLRIQTDFKLENARELAQSSLFMLSVLHAAKSDDELRGALWAHEHIEPTLLELTQARLAFQIVADLTRQNPEASAINQQTIVQARVLSHLSRMR